MLQTNKSLMTPNHFGYKMSQTSRIHPRRFLLRVPGCSGAKLGQSTRFSGAYSSNKDATLNSARATPVISHPGEHAMEARARRATQFRIKICNGTPCNAFGVLS